MKNLNKILFNFLWNSNVDKIKRKLTTQKYSYGGIQMIDLGCYIKALKSTWIRKIINDNDFKWLMLLKKMINTDKLINTGSSNLEIEDLHTENQFWKDTFSAYQEFQDNLEINDWNEYVCQPLWYNNNFRIDKQTIFYKSWYEKGLTHVIDLLDENGIFFINGYSSKGI